MPLLFLDYLCREGIPVTLRQVIVPGLNDSDTDAFELKKIINSHNCIDKVELLPFRKMCRVKYEKMGIDFPFEKYDEPSAAVMERLNEIINA